MNRQKYKGYDDWRLPALTDTGDPGCDDATVGTDCGSNVDVVTGELAHLWYGLGNIAFYDTNVATATVVQLTRASALAERSSNVMTGRSERAK